MEYTPLLYFLICKQEQPKKLLAHHSKLALNEGRAIKDPKLTYTVVVKKQTAYY